MKITTKDLLAIRAMEAKYGVPIAPQKLLGDADGRTGGLSCKVPLSLFTEVNRIVRETRISVSEMVTLALMDFIANEKLVDIQQKPAKRKGGRPAGSTNKTSLNEDEVRAWYAANGRSVDAAARHFRISWKRAKFITSSPVAQPVSHVAPETPTRGEAPPEAEAGEVAAK